MKNNLIETDKSPLKELRAIREKISSELLGKSPEQIIEFLKNKKTLHSKAYWK